MDGFIGADVADLRDFAKTMDKASHALLQEAQLISGAVNSIRGWRGPDADRFRQTWNSSHRPTMASTARSLQTVSDLLRKNAQEQETASSLAGLGGGATGGGGAALPVLKDVFDTGMGAKGLGSPLWQAWKYHRLGLDEWGKTREVLTNWDDAGKWLKGGLDELRAGGKAGNVLNDLKAGIPYSAAFEEASKFSKGMRLAGGLAAPLNIAGGIHDMISPPHGGWRGDGDRVAGGLSVVGGVGSIMLMTAGGAAMLGPIGAPIVIGAGIVAGAWALGNLVADNWGSITNFAKDPGKYLGEGLKDVGNMAKNAGSKVVDGIGSAAKSVGKFLGGIF